MISSNIRLQFHFWSIFCDQKANCIPRTKYVRGILWFSRRYAAAFVSPVRSTYGGYYGLVVVTPPRPPRPPRPRPRPQTLHRSHDNLKNPYRIASIFDM